MITNGHTIEQAPRVTAINERIVCEDLRDRILEVLIEWEPSRINLETLRNELSLNPCYDERLLASTLDSMLHEGIIGFQTEFLMYADYPEIQDSKRCFVTYGIKHRQIRRNQNEAKALPGQRKIHDAEYDPDA